MRPARRSVTEPAGISKNPGGLAQSCPHSPNSGWFGVAWMRLTTDPLKTTEATVNIWKISFSSGIRVLCGSLGTIRLAHPILPKIGAIGRFAPIRPDPPQEAWASRPHAARSKVRSRPAQSPFVPVPKSVRAQSQVPSRRSNLPSSPPQSRFVPPQSGFGIDPKWVHARPKVRTRPIPSPSAPLQTPFEFDPK